MYQHTPGPWACTVWMVGNNVPTGEITISGPEGDEHICTMDGNENNLANGNLIAAAPAMYLALQALLAHEGKREVSGIGTEHDSEALEAAKQAAQQAIAQAEGKG